MNARSTTQKSRSMLWIVALVFFVVGGVAALPLSRGVEKSRVLRNDASETAELQADDSIPNADFSPEQVVRLQMQSLRDGVLDPEKLVVCFSLASEENRKQTGPFPRFVELVKRPPYDQLGQCADFLIGDALVTDDKAMVFVSLLLPDKSPAAFRFFLSRRSEEPSKDCWLTDGVAFAPYLEPTGSAVEEQVDDASET